MYSHLKLSFGGSHIAGPIADFCLFTLFLTANKLLSSFEMVHDAELLPEDIDSRCEAQVFKYLGSSEFDVYKHRPS